MQLVVNDDPSVAAAPAGFQTAVSNAVKILDALIVNPITVTLDIGWGEDEGYVVSGGTLAEAQPATGIWVSYSQLVADLKSNTADTLSFKENLPATDPNNGGLYYLSIAQEKGLGLVSPTSTEVDGYVGVNANDSYTYTQSNGTPAGTTDLTGVLVHEMTHALGRYATPGFTTVLDLMTYDDTTGKLVLTNGANNKYISIDGGKTDLANLNTFSDPADLAGASVDPLNAFLEPGVTYKLTPLDSRLMNVLGFDTAPVGSGSSSLNTIVVSDGPVIRDASGNSWSIVAGQVAVNGVVDTTTKRVVAIGYGSDGRVWQENADLNWWSKDAPASPWVAGTPPAGIAHPTLPASANDTLLTNTNETIIDAKHNTWSLKNGGQVWVNGTYIAGTGHGGALAYVNGVVWEQAGGLWWGRSSPTAAWYPPNGQANSPITGSAVAPQLAHSGSTTVAAAGGNALQSFLSLQDVAPVATGPAAVWPPPAVQAPSAQYDSVAVGKANLGIFAFS